MKVDMVYGAPVLALAITLAQGGAEASGRSSHGLLPRGDALVHEAEAAPAHAEASCARRGPVEIPAAPAEERRRLIEEFQRRNGAEWAVELSRLGRTVSSASRSVDAEQPAVRMDETEARTLAIALVKRNADLFGLSSAEVDALTVTVTGEPEARRVELSGTIPRAGYEAFDSVAKSVFTIVAFSNDGRARFVGGRPQEVPPFELCTTPLLAPTDPRIHAQVIGRTLSFYDFGGLSHSAGEVEVGDIRSTSLTIFVHYPQGAGDPMRLVLAYAVHVEKGRLPWTFIVDADTGRLLETQQDFDT
ncbi:hypothetical protein WME95_19860 [Sorangium sp. So ce327]|jgi:hypothetical protein|uniref:hypothetical protein n=1 Tax=Sorangium sp. So ce327 TaxID=3133301 RepID=UPI003F629093